MSAQQFAVVVVSQRVAVILKYQDFSAQIVYATLPVRRAFRTTTVMEHACKSDVAKCAVFSWTLVKNTFAEDENVIFASRWF